MTHIFGCQYYTGSYTDTSYQRMWSDYFKTKCGMKWWVGSTHKYYHPLLNVLTQTRIVFSQHSNSQFEKHWFCVQSDWLELIWIYYVHTSISVTTANYKWFDSRTHKGYQSSHGVLMATYTLARIVSTLSHLHCLFTSNYSRDIQARALINLATIVTKMGAGAVTHAQFLCWTEYDCRHC